MCKRSSKLSKSPIATLKTEIPWATNVRTTDRVPRIYDFNGVLESVAWIWRVLGFFPIVIKGSTGVRRYELSKFYTFFNLLIFITSIGNFVHTIFKFGHYYSMGLPMTMITNSIGIISSLICMIFNNVWRIVRFKELSESINKITEQEIIMEKMSCRLSYKPTARIIRAYVWTTFVVVILFINYSFYIAYLNFKMIAIEWVLLSFPLLTQMMDLTILVSLVGCLGLKFRSINKKIRAVVTRANASSPKVIVTSDVCAENLRALSKIHYNTCAIGKRINRIFDWSVIVNVTTAFVIMSTTLYYIFYEVQRKGRTDFMLISSYVNLELMHSAPIIVIVIICNWTSSQSIYAGKLIHEIRVDRMDSRLYEAVKSFSLQLHHQKLEFTAGGFFPLDSSLLQTAVGTITTYLVILIQFEPKLD